MSDYIKREDAEKAILDCPISGMLDLINLQTAITNIDTISSADVVEVSKILKTADEQEKQGFIQTAKVLRELVDND